MPDHRPAAEVRRRILEVLQRRQVSQRELVRKLPPITGEDWTQSRLHKILSGRVELRYDDLYYIALVLDVPVVEFVREKELVADLSPSELALLNTLRDHPEIMHPLAALVQQLAPPPRKPSRAVVRARMARDRWEG